MINTLIIVFQSVLIIGVPLLLIKFRDIKLFKTVGTIGGAYFFGLLIAFIFFLLGKINDKIALNSDLGEIGSYVAIGIAIPLLLFNSNLKDTMRLSKRVLISFGGLTLSVLITTAVGYLIFDGALGENTSIFSGMAVGLYTGGTPNLNAIGSILGMDTTNIALANVSDMVFGGLFYFFLLMFCKPILKRILKTPPQSDNYVSEAENVDDVQYKVKFKYLTIALAVSLGAAIVGALIGVLIWVIMGSVDGKMLDFVVPALLITVTVIGVLGSLFKKNKEIRGANATGHYFLLVFSFALSMAFDYNMLNMSALMVFFFFAFITVGTLIVHTIFCFIFRIDVDCAMVTLTAGVYGPAFVPSIAKQIGNEKLTASGLICGSLGYAIGTFLGVGVGLLLALL